MEEGCKMDRIRKSIEEKNEKLSAGEFRGRTLTSLMYLEKAIREIKEAHIRLEGRIDQKFSSLEKETTGLKVKVATWSSLIALVISTFIYFLAKIIDL